MAWALVSETDLDGNISYLTFFSLICKMRMRAVSISRVFMKVYETIFGKHFVANAQLMIKIIRYFTYPADSSSRLLDKLQDGSLNVQEALDIAILNFKEGA